MIYFTYGHKHSVPGARTAKLTRARDRLIGQERVYADHLSLAAHGQPGSSAN